MEESNKRRRGSGEGAIFQRKSDGQWVARITSDRGKPKTLYGNTCKEVQDQLRDVQRKVDDGLNLDADRQTVALFLGKWLAASVKPSVRTRSYEGYENILRVRVTPRIGTKKLAKLSALDLQSLYTKLADTGLSPRSVHHTHRVLHRAFGQAVKWNLVSRNLCAGATARKTSRTEMKVWTPELARAFLTATAERPAHALYVLAYNRDAGG